MTEISDFLESRKAFHAALLQTTLTINSVGVVSCRWQQHDEQGDCQGLLQSN